MTKVTLTNRTLSLAALTCIVGGIGIEKSASALEFAFQKSNNHLALYNDGGITDLGQLMKPGTVPVFTLIPGGSGYEIGYQGSNGHFWVRLTNGVYQDTGLSMAAGTSPSVTNLGGQLAWGAQSPDGHLWVGLTGWHSGVDTHLVMTSGSSPSVAALPNGQFAWAARGLNGNFWISVNGPFAGFDTAGAILGATSPSIVAFPNSSVGFAIVGLDQALWTGDYLPSGQRKAAEYFCGANCDKYPASPSMISDSSGDVLITVHAPIIDKVVSYICQSSTSVFGVTGCNPGNDSCFMDLSASPTALYIDSSSVYAVAYKGTNGNLWLDYNYQCFDQHVAMN